MVNWIFVGGLALLFTLVYTWAFRTLPRERWQIMCAIPLRKNEDGSWQGLNLTFYGFFNAVGLSAAVGLVLVLAGSVGVSIGLLGMIVILLLGCCLPASKTIAAWVEKKPHTFSVGAASFVGIIAGPWLVLLMQYAAMSLWGVGFDGMAVFSSLMIGYALGEGIGRLACISFGCCYGRPMEKMPRVVQRFLPWATFTYSGGTKKIAYAHHLEGQRIFAVQAVTAVLYTAGALCGTVLFLNARFAWAYFVCLTVTQGWRFASEFYRTDFRGDRRISVYQIMSLLTIPYGLALPFFFSPVGATPDLVAGLKLLWHPAAILLLQVLWMVMFLRTGRSDVTGAGLRFFVNHERI